MLRSLKGDALKKLRKLLDQLIIVIPRNGLPLSTAYPTPGTLIPRCLANSVRVVNEVRP
jgi:hypothetical protein